MNLQEILSRPGAVVVDVRTPAEFMGGHVAGAINIPLQEVPGRVEEFRGMSRPLVLCCASGNRSGQAEYFLRSKGLEEVYNGGSWIEVNHYSRKHA